MTAGLVKPGDTIEFYARFISQTTGRGVTGLTVTVSVNRDTSNIVSVASATAATEVDATNQPGLYKYQLSGGSTGVPGAYFAYFLTADATVQTQSVTDSAIVGYVPANIAEIQAMNIEGTITLQQAMRIILAVLAGKADGGTTTLMHFRDTADLKNRITATVDAAGNRTAVTLDLS